MDGIARLERSVAIDAPIRDVWWALLDLERAVPCLPGAEITRIDDDGVHHGTFRIKFGPRSAVYRGTLRLESVDRTARMAVVAVSSAERASRVVRATVVGRADAGGRRTRLELVTELPARGLGARIGQSLIVEKASQRLLSEFAARLAVTARENPAPRAPRAQAPNETPSPPAAEHYPPRRSLTEAIASTLAGRRAAWSRARGRRASARARACPTCGAPGGRLCRRSRSGLLVPTRAHPARGWRERACPTCSARPGDPCLTATGRTARMPHAARLDGPRNSDRGAGRAVMR